MVRDNCFCCITISSPGITAFPAILQCCPFTHTHTHYVDTRAGTCYHHNLAVFSSPLLVMLSETVYLFAHLFLVTRQHRKVCKCLCVCLWKKKKKKYSWTCLSTKKKFFSIWKCRKQCSSLYFSFSQYMCAIQPQPSSFSLSWEKFFFFFFLRTRFSFLLRPLFHANVFSSVMCFCSNIFGSCIFLCMGESSLALLLGNQFF